MPRRLCRLLLPASALIAAAPLAHAGAPFVTDDPNTLDAGHIELLLFYQGTLNASGRVGSAPGLDIHLGLMPGLELDIIPALAFSSPPSGNTRWGYGDTSIEIKYQVVAESERVPLVSLVPQLNLPTGDAARGLGNGASQVALAIAAQKTIDAFQTYTSAGYWINNGAGNRNYWLLGWVAQYAISDAWTVGAEIFHTTAQQLGASSSTGFNVGGYYQLDARTQLMVSAGRGLQNASQTNRASTYAGVLVAF